VTLTPHPLLVPWSRKGRAITLLPLWAVRPVQSLTACTRVHFTFTIVIAYVLRCGHSISFMGLTSSCRAYVDWGMDVELYRVVFEFELSVRRAAYGAC